MVIFLYFCNQIRILMQTSNKIMDNKKLILNANPIVDALQKPAADFTKADIISYIVDHEIRMVNFMYPGGDGKLKTLNFVINDLNYLDTIDLW